MFLLGVSFRENQALKAPLFLLRQVLHREVGLMDALRARKPRRLPTVLTRGETQRLLTAISGTDHRMAKLLYGSGLRALEYVRLRVKDLDFEQRLILVRDGKGQKDRITMLPGQADPQASQRRGGDTCPGTARQGRCAAQVQVWPLWS
jgi:integrase